MKFNFFSAAIILSLLFSANSEAAKKRGGKGAFAGGSLSVGFGIAFATAEQSGINEIIQNAKAVNQSTASDLNSATEYSLQGTFRFSNGLVAIQLRPSLFQQSQSHQNYLLIFVI